MTEREAKNTDRELWRERPGDFYADSLFVTEGGGIGLNCGGTVCVKPIRAWMQLAIDAARANLIGHGQHLDEAKK